MTTRILATVSVTVGLALGPAGAALAVTPTTGQPN